MGHDAPCTTSTWSLRFGEASNFEPRPLVTMMVWEGNDAKKQWVPQHAGIGWPFCHKSPKQPKPKNCGYRVRKVMAPESWSSHDNDCSILFHHHDYIVWLAHRNQVVWMPSVLHQTLNFPSHMTAGPKTTSSPIKSWELASNQWLCFFWGVGDRSLDRYRSEDLLPDLSDPDIFVRIPCMYIYTYI